MTKKKFLIGAAVVAALGLASYGYFTRSASVYSERALNAKKDPVLKLTKSQRARSCVVLWSINCQACLYSMPHLNILQQHLAMNGGKLILVLAEDHIMLRKSALAMFLRYNLHNLSTYYDKKNGLQRRYAIKAYPTMLVFNSKGKLVKRVEGFSPWAQGDKIQEILGLISQ